MKIVRRRDICAYDVHPRPAIQPVTPMPAALASAMRLVTALACFRGGPPATVLTYDDGPDPQHTPRVLETLRAHDCHATFFVLLDEARRHPDLIRQIVSDGHDVGLHGEDHERVSALGTISMVRRTANARRELSQLTGRPVRFYRPAYGAIRLTQLVAVQALGLQVVIWSAWARDWENRSVEELADNALASLHPGAVLLLHDAARGLDPHGDDRQPDVPTFDRGELTARLVSRLETTGYEILSVSEACAQREHVRSPWFESKAEARRLAGPQPTPSALRVVR